MHPGRLLGGRRLPAAVKVCGASRSPRDALRHDAETLPGGLEVGFALWRNVLAGVYQGRSLQREPIISRQSLSADLGFRATCPIGGAQRHLLSGHEARDNDQVFCSVFTTFLSDQDTRRRNAKPLGLSRCHCREIAGATRTHIKTHIQYSHPKLAERQSRLVGGERIELPTNGV